MIWKRPSRIIPEDQRPGKVVVAVITDGQENSSKEFRKEQIVRMIKERTDKDNWQFVFLSSDLGAIGDAVAYGIDPNAALLFQKTQAGTAGAWASLATQVSTLRSGKKQKIGFAPDNSMDPKDPKKA